jgi:ubiquinone/menaquinone biosynthesis C-methylase UbiE
MSVLARSQLARLLVPLAGRTPLRRFVMSAVHDPQTGTFIGSGDMQRDWDKRARRNARFFVAGYDWQSEEQFRRSGERDLDTIMLKGLDLPPDAVAIEIGCGLGRLLRPLSPRVREAHGVDISSEMVRRAAEDLRDCPNVHLHHTDGGLQQFANSSFDFAYSYTVFQHITDKAAVLRYLRDTARVLRPNAIFRFQICRGDEQGPRGERGGSWLGVVFSEEELRSVLSEYGFTVISIELDDSPASRQLWDSVVVTCRRNSG